MLLEISIFTSSIDIVDLVVKSPIYVIELVAKYSLEVFELVKTYSSIDVVELV